MAEPREHEPGDAPTVMRLLAARVRMTEGQLYTAIIAVLSVVLLSLTGLPNAERPPTPDFGPQPIPDAQEVTP